MPAQEGGEPKGKSQKPPEPALPPKAPSLPCPPAPGSQTPTKAQPAEKRVEQKSDEKSEPHQEGRKTWNKHAGKWREPGEDAPYTEMTSCEYCWRPVAVQGLKNHWRTNLKCRQYQREQGVDMAVSKQEYEASLWEECSQCGKKYRTPYDLEQHMQHSHGRSSGSKASVRLRSRSTDRSSALSKATERTESALSAQDDRLGRPPPDRVLEQARSRRREGSPIRPDDSMSQAGSVTSTSSRQGQSIRGLADLFQAAANIIKSNIDEEA